MTERKAHPNYKRQRFLLNYLKLLDEGVSATDVQKLIFLYCQTNNINYYEFIPYKFGPYSFQLAEDLDILCRDNFVEYNNHVFVTKEECHQVPSLIVPAVDERGDSLIKKVYEGYPYYAINSEILGRLFSQEEMRKFYQVKQKLRKTRTILYTIGYEGKSLEAFVNLLIRNDVRLLCDVRRNPISRKFGFSKAKLQHVLETVGVKYIHIPEVGISSEKRTSLNTAHDYDELFKDYKSNLNYISHNIDAIGELQNTYKRIALMCYEENPQICHRHIIRDYIVEKYNVPSEDL